jgi:Molecular chaperone (small heat shock protein)
MPRTSSFGGPYLLGFENLERLVEHVAKNAGEGYPPYNIEQIGDNDLRITLAVAGFSLDDLSVVLEDNQLVIRGRRQDDERERVFLYRGIAARQFQRTFLIADGIEVTGATLDNGLLHVDLHRRLPEPEVRKINIRRGSNPASASAQVQSPSPPARTIDVSLES